MMYDVKGNVLPTIYDIYGSEAFWGDGWKSVLHPLEWNASSIWTETGMIHVEDDWDIYAQKMKDVMSATKIPVVAGDKFHIEMNLYMGGGNHGQIPIVFIDSSGLVIWKGNNLTGTEIEVTAPVGSAWMGITYYNNAFPLVIKKWCEHGKILSPVESSHNMSRLVNRIENNYKEWTRGNLKSQDKAVFMFGIDDCRIDMDQIADMFERKGVPLCINAIADSFKLSCSNTVETRLDVAKRVVRNGGEVLAHSGYTLLSEDYNGTLPNNPIRYASNQGLFEQLGGEKQIIELYGFNVRGIITAGGNGYDSPDMSAVEKWTKYYYDYSDHYGTAEPFLFQRRWLGYSGYTGEDAKYTQFCKEVDNAVSSKGRISFYFHDTSEVSLAQLERMLNYVKSKDCYTMTYSEFYDTYYYGGGLYFSTSGNDSNDGLTAGSPKKDFTKYLSSGEKLYLKSGDTWYVNDLQMGSNTSITTYGGSKKAVLSGLDTSDNTFALVENNVYEMTLNAYDISYIFIDGKISRKRIGFGSRQDFENYGEFTFNKTTKILRVYTDKNLSGKTITFIHGTHGISIPNGTKNVTISNIELYGYGQHGISGGTLLENIKVLDCYIHEIGGAIWVSNGGIKYGNGIQIWSNGCKDVLISGNIVENCFDTGITFQCGDKDIQGHSTNLVIENNFCQKCVWLYEVFNHGSKHHINGVKIRNNVGLYADDITEGYRINANAGANAHLIIWDLYDEDDIEIYDNVFLYNQSSPIAGYCIVLPPLAQGSNFDYHQINWHDNIVGCSRRYSGSINPNMNAIVYYQDDTGGVYPPFLESEPIIWLPRPEDIMSASEEELSTTYTSVVRQKMKREDRRIHNYPRIGGIGDSLMASLVANTDGTGIAVARKSWLNQLAYRYGNHPSNYAINAITAKTWLANHLHLLLEDDPCDLYFIALATNDAGTDIAWGEATDAVGADTYCGQMKQIISNVHNHAPDAKIVLVGFYNTSYKQKEKQIDDLANLYDYTYHIDFSEETQMLREEHCFGGHFDAVGYRIIADIVEAKFDELNIG